MKTYNKKKADQLTKDFQILAKTDITNQTNQTEWVVLRSLYYKVLKDFNNMNDQRISDYLLSIDICKDRSSIHVARAKVDLYYDQFDFFRDAYNLFFKDKEVAKCSKKEVEVVNEEPKDALEALIRTIPSHRRDEVLEMVSLRIKSWEWKSKDSCKVMVCFDGISNYAY
jgi:hypothetical protein